MNIFANLPTALPEEEILPLHTADNLRIERILSTGQSSPPGFWYDQQEHEWVMVLQGEGVVEFADGRLVTLSPGDHLHIPPHARHRVKATSQKESTLWLAVFWKNRVE